MIKTIPGTTLQYSEKVKTEAFSLISPILSATGGLTLSQLSKLTGLGGSTIQNWIKRGWVVNIPGKKYYEVQVIRILLINMLRGTMQLENIAVLMNYINGKVEDTSDDIIPDIDLYNIFCTIICELDEKKIFESEPIRATIKEVIKHNDNYVKEQEEILENTLFIMTLAYQSSLIKAQLEAEYERLDIKKYKL
ncbi:MAG: DUF1836 domain-containing protein [Oscillospiraceae bacterium]|jgi:DNA-binding transcriptional MerR regulator|uniref:DUF1836 domain-containing protein n=1 Tax=Ruminococcus sp. HUN007 TaxID=1514668 RepID=UPI0005D1AE75|nr:DUF1836 domain-containing protein [Ruminococcus sp. HUN007]MBQ5336103.1 DUF1836 domain-containing protein [Oscillospiraceae bacterium]MBQ5990319.1 DUF1836 domain-containing protein [Oscillospiraceae bacterium]MBR3023104.1 DUF1836 domain-containing protein [Oscillospiraceae bacterium]MBR3535382.1 DUF1836 domain-containing protein [Oscillospiraceae bacterium]MBR6834652.1 DUF1836 domain-containing protein [Oscillospiraceae bacterium]